MISRGLCRAAVAVLVALAGCGGGEGADPIQVTLAPGLLEASFRQGVYVPAIQVSATLDRLPDAETVYVLVVPDQPVLGPLEGDITQSGNTFSAWLKPLCALEPGSYSGSVTLKLCRDAACRDELPLSGNTVPYAFTVMPGFALRARIDGVAVPGITTACTGVDPRSWFGHTVQLESTTPVTWTLEILSSAGMPTLSSLSTTDTTWTGTLANGDPYNPGGVYAPNTCVGFVRVQATPLDTTLVWRAVTVGLWAP